MSNEALDKTINAVTKQFMCNIPIKKFKWNNLFEIVTYDYQGILVNRTVNSDLVLKNQIEINYQKAFLKHLIENLEKQDSEIHDIVFSAYGRLVALPSQNEYECFKHYCLQNEGNIISLKENVNLISQGTTGLRTWQAALVLSEWSLLNVLTFKNKVVLELGSGVGLTGLTISTQCFPKTVYLTDCHVSVLKTLEHNVKLNMENNIATSSCNISTDTSDIAKLFQDRCIYSISGKPDVFVLNLPWEEINKENCMKLGTINTVIAADVVYDCELFDPLIRALKCLAAFCYVDEFIFSCTERNKDTLETFVYRIREVAFRVEELQIPRQFNFNWPDDTPIRLLRFTM